MKEDEIRYSEQDVRKIIQKALEIQKRRSVSEGPREVGRSGEYTIDDVEQAAGEIGLNSELVHQAALELQSAPRTEGAYRFLGAETTVLATGMHPAPVDDEALHELAAMMQTITGITGVGNVHGSVYTWTLSGHEVERRGFSTEINVRSRKQGTIIDIRERLGMLAGGIYGGIAGGVGLGAGLGVGFGVGLGALDSGIAVAIISIGTLGLSFWLSRVIYRAIVRQRRRATREILQRILQFFAEKRD